MRKVLKEDLVNFYRKNHDTIPLTPLIENEHTSLTKLYVLPNINRVHDIKEFGGIREVRSRVKSLQAVFDGKIGNDIYLTADAGLGKTSFSKRLALAWCQAHMPIEEDRECFTDLEIDAVKNFDFLFLVFLRDSGTYCGVDDLITKRIVQGLAHSTISKEKLEELLSEERCLVILDGLDEWTHPQPVTCTEGINNIPHRKARNWTVLTTSRPWKLSVINLNSTQIDQKLEITGLSRESANKLKMNVLTHISSKNYKTSLVTRVEEFDAAIKQKQISAVEDIPLLLIFMLGLWCENKNLGDSLCELYSNIIKHLLSKTKEKYDEMPPLGEFSQDDIPDCFSKQTPLNQCYALLTPLSELAFKTLFDEKKENTLVFNNSIAETYLNKTRFEFCLKSGILTQSRVMGKPAKVSFSHKSVQEFFAALYLHSTRGEITVEEKVLSRCTSIKSTLELSKVFIFLSGMNVNVSSSISGKLTNVINLDKETLQYRAATYVIDYDKTLATLKETQNLYISCLNENPNNVDLKLSLQDIVIDEDCTLKSYYDQLQQLVTQNKENIRSVNIEMKGIQYNVKTIIDSFELTHLRKVQKISYRGDFHDNEITPLLQSSVKSLALISSIWKDNDLEAERSEWHHLVSSKFYELKDLEAINIDDFNMNHDQLQKLFEHVSERKNMREISLWNLFCHQHMYDCTGFSLNLSKCSHLKTLSLGSVPVSELLITDISSLEECTVGHSYMDKHCLVSRFLRYLPAASKLHTFRCSYLTRSNEINEMVDTLGQLKHIKDLRLLEINLGDRELPQMVNIEFVFLRNVKMSSLALRKLVGEIKNVPQTVTVCMRGQTRPNNQFEKEKENIKTYPQFTITVDDFTKNQIYTFEFIKIGKNTQ